MRIRSLDDFKAYCEHVGALRRRLPPGAIFGLLALVAIGALR
jgi:hypothetical protein